MATETQSREDALLPGLSAALARCADPEGAPALALAILEAVGGERLARLDAAAANRVLAAICGAAPFLTRFLAAHPELFCRLVEDDLGGERGADEYAARVAQALAGADGDEESLLRLVKYAELARITVRELSADLVPPERTRETLGELSHLADALLAHALATARARIAAQIGPARWTTAEGAPYEPRFAALGLGKLGGEELNYSSDVDLIYLYEPPPGGVAAPLTAGPQELSPREYFTRVGQEFGRITVANTAEGFLYRVDLDLRPEGAAGPLVIAADELAGYHDLWAATWEKAAFMKARPVAGDLAFGWSAIRAIDPMIYRSSMDFAGVSAIRAMKEQVERERAKVTGPFDVKIGSGGIRDVEFVAQALQLLHGGRIPQVRDRSTQGTLERLAQVGLLGPEDARVLLDAYRFLRRVENRIQMVAERQTHRLPSGREALLRLARASGFAAADPLADFDAALQAHRREVQRVFAAVFPASAGSRVLALFQRNAPQLLANPLLRGRIEELAERFAHAIEGSPGPERAMNNLDRFIQGVGSRSFYYGLLVDRPELVPRLAALFAASEYLSTYLASHPRLIEPIFSDPNVLLLSRAELEAELRQIRDDLAAEGEGEDVETDLDALRLFHNRELINIGLLDLSAKVGTEQAEAALTELAEVCLARALDVARAEMARARESRGRPATRAEREGEFLVVGMGKLASRELTYGSDLDVIFLYDLASADDAELGESQEYFGRLAQKLIWALQTRTREGVCYQIDARLRPSGNQGMLVSSLTALRRHHRQLAMVWERQALLRARPVAGSPALAESFRTLRLEVLRQPFETDPAAEIRRIRQRVEHELAQETTVRHDFKTGRGGLMDVEYVVQYLQLRHGGAHPALFSVDGIAAQIQRLADLRLLSPEDARVLGEAWAFLQRLSSRLRIVENRSISDLDEERGDLDDLAQQLGYDASQRASAARRALLDDYRRHTAGVRAVYDRVLAAS